MKREAEKVEHTTYRQAAAPVCELGSNPNNMAALPSRARRCRHQIYRPRHGRRAGGAAEGLAVLRQHNSPEFRP